MENQPDKIKQEQICKQVEYYLSDQNLKKDKFFHDKVSSDPEGYIDVSFILSCNKIKVFTSNKDDLLKSLEGSILVERHPSDDRVRRVNNRSLPKFEETKDGKKNVKKHDNGPEEVVSTDSVMDELQEKDFDDPIMFSVKRNEEGKTSWKDIENAIKSDFSELRLVYTRMSEENEGHIGLSSRRKNEEAIKRLVENGLKIGDITLEIKKIEGKDLDSFWEQHGSHFVFCSNQKKSFLKKRAKKLRAEKGEEAPKKKAKKTFTISGVEYEDINKVKSKSRAILNLKKNGEVIEGKDKDFLLELLKQHEKYEQKSKDLKDIIVNDHPEHENTRCFFVVRNDGTQEDFSVSKCIQNLQNKSESQ